MVVEEEEEMATPLLGFSPESTYVATPPSRLFYLNPTKANYYTRGTALFLQRLYSQIKDLAPNIVYLFTA